MPPTFQESAVADQFDPYREALVMEVDTIWPDDLAPVPPAKRQQLEQALHANPASCEGLSYLRTHTGFCRTITVTQADLDRLS